MNGISGQLPRGREAKPATSSLASCRAPSIDKTHAKEKMFGNAAKGVVLRRRTGDWHMYVISAFAGVVGGFYIWLEPLRELQMNSLAKDAAAAKAAKEDKK